MRPSLYHVSCSDLIDVSMNFFVRLRKVASNAGNRRLYPVFPINPNAWTLDLAYFLVSGGAEAVCHCVDQCQPPQRTSRWLRDIREEGSDLGVLNVTQQWLCSREASMRTLSVGFQGWRPCSRVMRKYFTSPVKLKSGTSTKTPARVCSTQ